MSKDPVTTIRNIGPAMAQDLAKAGIHTADDLRNLGGDEAYRRMLNTGTRPHFIAYYVLHMGLQGRPWNDCKGAEKDALRASFDAIKARVAQPGVAQSGVDHAIEHILDQIGAGIRR